MSNENSNSATAPRLVLASASPRRAQLLRDHGFSFDMVVPPFEEPVSLPGVDDPVELARRLSVLKAESARGIVQRGVILAGDTIAALGHRVFGKAENRDDARRILTAITAATHRVITAVTLLDADSGRSRTEHAVTEVTMRALSEQEMQEYLDSGAWIGKAGAYGIQDHGDRFVTRLDGSFSNVVGLPVEIVVEMLAEWGIRPAEHL